MRSLPATGADSRISSQAPGYRRAARRPTANSTSRIAGAKAQYSRTTAPAAITKRVSGGGGASALSKICSNCGSTKKLRKNSVATTSARRAAG
ncbi:MAG TPA: hypothetical protein DEA50_13140 [Parvularcula sp.]|nr:hypothetical protein [Parvularcula sp.]